MLGNGLDNSVAVPEDFSLNPFLPRYVADPPRWAFINAVRYFYDYARVYAEATKTRAVGYCFIDAGGATNRHVYGRYLVEAGLMSPEEDEFYALLCDLVSQTLNYPEPHAYIFLRASPETCFARMQARAWTYQTNHIPVDYLVVLERYFRLFQNEIASASIPFLELDSEAIDLTDPQAQDMTLTRVRAWLDTLKLP